MTEPCTLNSNTWELSGPNCDRCGHHGFLHPGGGGSELTHCLICAIVQLETALQTRTRDLDHELDRVDRLIAYIADRYAMPHISPPAYIDTLNTPNGVIYP